jgi:hypothetical protein
MKRILCYGDSNTRGSLGDGRRMDDAKQWPNVLQVILDDGYRVVQEGLGGRVAGELDERAYMNGRVSFEVMYRSAAPVDLVVIALGTNDLKSKYGRTAKDIADDLLWYGDAIQQYGDVAEDKSTKMLYVCPENHPDSEPGIWAELVKIMKQFDEPVLDLGKLETGPDGLHYSENAHAEVANKVKTKIEEMSL